MMDNFEGRNPEVSESADNAAEQKAINAQEIHDFKEKLISSVSSGVLDSVVGRPDEFESQLRKTLDELIMTYFRNNVNTAEISNKTIQTLSTDLQNIMKDFVQSVQAGVGMALDASDVRDVYDIDSQLSHSKSQFAEYFEKRYLSRYLSKEVSSGVDDCDLGVEFSSGVFRMDASYEFNERENVSIAFGNLDFVSKAKSSQNDLASRIRQKDGVFDFRSVNYEVDNVSELDEKIGLSDEKLASMSLAEVVDYVYLVLKKNLKIDPAILQQEGVLEADTLPIDSLLGSKVPVLCRHIVAIFKTVMKRLRDRQVELNGDSAPMFGVEFMEVENYGLQHGTLAVVKGDRVVVLEPSFSLSQKKESIMDATFSSTHGTSVTHFLQQLTVDKKGERSVLGAEVLREFAMQASEVVRNKNLRESEMGRMILKAWPHLVITQSRDILLDASEGSADIKEVDTLVVNLFGSCFSFVADGVSEMNLTLANETMEVAQILRECMSKSGKSDMVRKIDSLVLSPLSRLLDEFKRHKNDVEFDVTRSFDQEMFQKNVNDFLSDPHDENLLKIVSSQFNLGVSMALTRMFYIKNNIAKIGFQPSYLDSGLSLAALILKVSKKLQPSSEPLVQDCKMLRKLFDGVTVTATRFHGVEADKYTG